LLGLGVPTLGEEEISCLSRRTAPRHALGGRAGTAAPSGCDGGTSNVNSHGPSATRDLTASSRQSSSSVRFATTRIRRMIPPPREPCASLGLPTTLRRCAPSGRAVSASAGCLGCTGRLYPGVRRSASVRHIESRDAMGTGVRRCLDLQ
jgi:hypothetical protein